LREKLKPYGQEHLLKFWPELSESEKDVLFSELSSLDVANVCKCFQQVMSEKSTLGKKLDSQMQPIPEELKGSYEQAAKSDLLKSFEKLGLEAIASNQVGVLLLAGGQGTRLGVTYPKGMYSVDLLSGKTLFQIQAERLIKVKELAEASSSTGKSVKLPWYIMASEQTLDQTKEFFQKNSYFGLKPEDVVFFEQGTLPCFTNDGKIILDRKFKLSRAPDGNGGLYKALVKQRILDDMSARGLKYLHVYCVDNVLVKMADPVFTGFAISKNANCASKAVKKEDPEEKVGVICKVNERYQIVEYSEISEATRNLRDSNGELTYNAGNICNHFLTTEFLSELCLKHEDELKHHIAEKKIPYIDDDGLLKKPTANNGIKLEKFIFDIFPFSNASWAKGNFVLWEVLREEEFSPLKNANDAKSDNPTTCRNDLMEQHFKWLKRAGASLKRDKNLLSNPDYSVPKLEISSLVSYNGENLEAILKGNTFEEPLIIDLDKKLNKLTFNGLDLDTYKSKFNL